jgi:hypothetical protein
LKLSYAPIVRSAITHWWNDGPRKVWQDEFADPERRASWLNDLANTISNELEAALAQQAQPPTDDEMRAVWAARFVRILDDTENVKDAQMHRAYLLADAVLALLDAPKPGTRMNLEQLSRAEGCSECGYNIPPNGVHASWCPQNPKGS